jgi:hypothetical protein
MGAPEILGRLTAAGLKLEATGDRLRVWPAERLTDELRTLIRTHKPNLLACLGGSSIAPLSASERAALHRLTRIWGMDIEDRAVMLRQCERGGELAGGSWISPDDARAFWLGEAGAIH